MKLLTILLLALSVMSAALASPGAHGPDGEHLDGAVATAGANALPRVETFTESFELVGQLSGGELSIMIDRYETNEPVLGGTLEVEYKGLKAPAKFHADHGDYAIDNPALLAALSKQGSHPLLFTLIAGDESDLLEGTLVVGAVHADDRDDVRAWPWVLGIAMAAALIGAVLVHRRLNRKDLT